MTQWYANIKLKTVQPNIILILSKYNNNNNYAVGS